MGDKQFIIWLSDRDFLLVIIKAEKGYVLHYVVKYISEIDGNEYEIARFDSGHEYTHVDILRPDGTKDRVVRFPGVNKEAAVEYGINNFRLNFDLYRERFIRWLKQ